MLNFNGRRIVKPGAYSKVSTDGSTPITLGSTKILAIIGESDRGEPQKVLWFNSPAEAKRTLNGGALLTAANIAWSPSNELPGADLVALVRVNQATRASHVLRDNVSAEAITLTSRDWGVIPYMVRVVVSGDDRIVTLTDGVTTEVSPPLATNAAIVAWINSDSSLVTAVAGIGTLITAVPTLTAFSTAGTTIAPTFSDWERCCNLLSTEPVTGVVPVTSDAIVHNYVTELSMLLAREGRERRAFFGHAEGETVNQVIARAEALNNQRACLVTPGIKRIVDGVVSDLSPVFGAALIAGLWCGLEDQEPVTFKYVNILGVSTEYTSLEINNLLENGVIAVEPITGRGYRVVQGLTTHQGADLIYRELSMATMADVMSKDLREDLEGKFVGRAYSSSTMESMYNAVVSRLNVFVRNGWLVGSEENPPFRGITIVKEGTAFRIDYEGSVSTPNNFMLITSHFKPAV